MKLWQDKIKKVVPYVPGEQPKIKDIVKIVIFILICGLIKMTVIKNFMILGML